MPESWTGPLGCALSCSRWMWPQIVIFGHDEFDRHIFNNLQHYLIAVASISHIRSTKGGYAGQKSRFIANSASSCSAGHVSVCQKTMDFAVKPVHQRQIKCGLANWNMLLTISFGARVVWKSCRAMTSRHMIASKRIVEAERLTTIPWPSYCAVGHGRQTPVITTITVRFFGNRSEIMKRLGPDIPLYPQRP